MIERGTFRHEYSGLNPYWGFDLGAEFSIADHFFFGFGLDVLIERTANLTANPFGGTAQSYVGFSARARVSQLKAGMIGSLDGALLAARSMPFPGAWAMAQLLAAFVALGYVAARTRRWLLIGNFTLALGAGGLGALALGLVFRLLDHWTGQDVDLIGVSAYGALAGVALAFAGPAGSATFRDHVARGFVLPTDTWSLAGSTFCDCLAQVHVTACRPR